MSEQQGKVRRFRWLVALAALGVFAGVAEVALRFGKPQPDPYEGLLRPVVHDRFVVSRHAPGAATFTPDPQVLSGLSPQTTFTVNAFGFRSPRLTTREKPTGAVRVFVVGGSTAECLYLDDGEAWPELVQQALAGEVPGLDVINTGRSGDSTREHLALLAHRIAAFAPDAVVFLVGLNDLDVFLRPDYAPLGGDARSKLRHRRFSTTEGVLAKLTRRSHLARGLTWLTRGDPPATVDGNPVQDGNAAWTNAARTRLRNAPEATVDGAGIPPAEYAQNLRSLIGLTRAHGAVPVLVTQPAIWGAAAGAWEHTLWFQPRPGKRIAPAAQWKLLEAVNDVTRRVAQAQTVPLIDLARGLPKDPRYFYDDAHFTVAGAAAVARVVTTALRKQGIVARLKSGRTTPGE